MLDHFFGFDPASNNHVTSFGAGNIILGGDGSDLIFGKDGDDLIDGDKWLNVRISVRANKDGTGPEIATFDNLMDMVPLMLNGTYNPGQLVIVREILTDIGGLEFVYLTAKDVVRHKIVQEIVEAYRRFDEDR